MKILLHSLCGVIITLLLMSCGSSGQIFKKSGDVGDCKLPGSFTYDKKTGTYTLSGSGYDMWFEIDEFFMVWQEVSGDFKLSAKVKFEGEGTHPLRKMGLIIRETLEPDARHANVAVHGNGLTALQYRSVIGGETLEFRSENTMPDHIVLERKGNRLIMKTGVGAHSDKEDASFELNLPATCYVGLFICSHEVDLLETAYFSDVKLQK
jgi:hypothetical protein